MARKAKMALTQQQYQSLCAEAKDLHDYWREWNRSLYEEAAKDGSLYDLLLTKGQELQDEMDELILRKRMQENEAREIVWQEIYSSYSP